MGDQYGFLFADKQQSFLQFSAIVFDGCGQACPKYPKWQNCNFSKKEGRDKADFLHADKQQTILQDDTIKPGGHDQASP